MRIRQFDIWIADLNPRRGTEPGNIRPVIVVQSDLLGGEHPSTIVCPITTVVNPGVQLLRVHLRRSTSGLKDDSCILIDQVRSIDNRRLIRKVGSVSGAAAELIRKNLRIVMDLD